MATVNSGTNQRNFGHSYEEIELTKNVKIDQNCGRSEITIFVYSTADTSGNNFNKRQSTRKTWVEDAIKFNIQVFFVIAEPKDNETQKDLELEAFQYKDMIQFGFREDYYNCTLKHIAFMRWAQHKCLDTKYIMKADDDIILNINQLMKNLYKFKSGITGIVLAKRKPHRYINSKWYLPESIFPDFYYPDYLFGPAYIMTRDIIKPMIETLDQYLDPVIDIDDIFITGILAEKAGVKRHDSNKFRYSRHCRIGVCFMFNNIVLFECKSSHQSLDFWKRWKDTTPDWCQSFRNQFQVLDIIIIMLFIGFILFFLLKTRMEMKLRRGLNRIMITIL
jgi:hypothetical protein